MGSLMAGWDSKSERYKRNWTSLTKEEIEAYWKSKKKIEEEHFRAVSSPSDHSTQERILMEEMSKGKFRRSSSLPLANRKEGSMDMASEINWESIIKKSGWWTRSNWAFLNEPPVKEGDSNSYASQFHVANLPPLNY